MPFIALDSATAQPAPVTTLGAPLTAVGSTLASLRADLSRLIVGRTDVDSATLDEWINEAYTDLFTSLDLDEAKGSLQLTLVPGQPLYRLPYVVSHIKGAAIQLPESENIGEGYPLDKVDLSVYRSMRPADDEPRMFFRHGDMVVLYPTPSVARTVVLDVIIRPVWMTSDLHSPLFGLEWHEPLKKAARQKAFSAMLEFDKSGVLENELISSVRRRTNRKEEEEVGRVVGSSVPTRARHIRNRVLHDTYEED